MQRIRLQAEKAFRELDKDRRKKDYEARKAEREARELEKKIRDLENNPPPYDIECTDCDQLIMYIEKLVGVKDNKAGGQLTDEEKFKAAQAAIQGSNALLIFLITYLLEKKSNYVRIGLLIFSLSRPLAITCIRRREAGRETP